MFAFGGALLMPNIDINIPHYNYSNSNSYDTPAIPQVNLPNYTLPDISIEIPEIKLPTISQPTIPTVTIPNF